jgi:hypothetical protein
MAVAAEIAADVTRQRAHIGALAAFDFENRAVVIALRHQHRQPVDLDLAGGDVDGFAATARQIIGALTGDLDRRKLRRDLHDHAGIFRHEVARIACSVRAHIRASL